MMNNLLWMLMGTGALNGIKDKLIQLGIPPETLQGVDFNNVQSLNALAQKIMPGLLANNKDLTTKLRSMSGMLGAKKQREINQVIDSL